MRIELNKIVDEIEGPENKRRKLNSQIECDILSDDLTPYVRIYLEKFYSDSTASEVPIISSVNVAKRIVENEAGLYKKDPVRTFIGVSETQASVLNQIYHDLDLNDRLSQMNKKYRMQAQSHLAINLEGGYFVSKSLSNHHIDVIPEPLNPEKAHAYVLSPYVREQVINPRSDGMNQAIADLDDSKYTVPRTYVSDDFMFFFKDGAPQSVEIENPLGLKPIVEVSFLKDNEYWVRGNQSLSNFTIQFNGALSDLMMISRLQGFAQAVYKGPSNMIPSVIKLGPNRVLVLATDPNNPEGGKDAEFSYVSANPDLKGSMELVFGLLSAFLTTRGLDPKIISSSNQAQSFTSGFDRYLSMIDRFESSQDDMKKFKRVEEEVFQIVKRYIEVYAGTQFLKYNIGKLPKDASLMVEFKKPELVVTESDKVSSLKEKLDLGLISKVDALKYLRPELSDEEAASYLDKISVETTLSL